MSEFKNKSITSKGLELLARALAGEQLTFTKIEMGSGNFEGTVSEAIQMGQPQQTLPITNLTRKGGQVTLSAGLKIEDITNSFEWTEIGVYAKGEDEIETLYMYGYTQDSSFVSKDSLNEKLINVTVMVSNATNISATINNSLVYLTAEALETHSKDMSTHQDIRQELSALGKQLGQLDITWENIEGRPTSFPPTQHNHSMGNIEGLEQALQSKAPTHDHPYALTTHTHPYASNTHTHTKADVGLSNVPNYSATSSVTDSSTSKFATASAVKQAYDKAIEALQAANTTKGCVISDTVQEVSLASQRAIETTAKQYYCILSHMPRYNGYVKVRLVVESTVSGTTREILISNESLGSGNILNANRPMGTHIKDFELLGSKLAFGQKLGSTEFDMVCLYNNTKSGVITYEGYVQVKAGHILNVFFRSSATMTTVFNRAEVCYSII